MGMKDKSSKKTVGDLIGRPIPKFTPPAVDLEKLEEAAYNIIPFDLPDISEMIVKPAHPRMHPDDLKAIVGAIDSSSPKKTPAARASYQLPEEAVWEKLKIKFADGHTVKVRYPGMKTATFDYKDMGFIDRKTNNPDIKWEFLRDMAEEHGRWPVERYIKKYHKTTKYQLSQRLQQFFGINSDPFHPYKKKEGYSLRFSLYPDTGPNHFNEEE